MENLNNPELLHPEIHFHPTHLHRSDISNKSNMHEDHENLGTSYIFDRIPLNVIAGNTQRPNISIRYSYCILGQEEMFENSSNYQYDVESDVNTNISDSSSFSDIPKTNSGEVTG